MGVNYPELIGKLESEKKTFSLLTMQAASTTEHLMKRFPDRFKSLFSAEHGFFGLAAAGERTPSAWHPFWNRPIHSLYGETRRPTAEMLEGVERIIIDIADIGVRCYTYLATVKNILEACADAGIAVTVLDRGVPMGNVMDGPMRKPEFASFVAPINVPLCHGMTIGESATWIKHAESLDVDLDVVRLTEWDHKMYDPWANYIPPSPSIRSWDCAVAYPMTVFTEAYPAVDCDRDGSLSFRVIGAPWMNTRKLMTELEPGLKDCGVDMRPYRYSPKGGRYQGLNLNGILFTLSNPKGYYPVTASALIYAALMQLHGHHLAIGARPEWLDKLYGSTELRDTINSGNLKDMFQKWIAEQDEYLKTKVNLYPC